MPADLDAATFTALLPPRTSLEEASGWHKGMPRAITTRFAALRELLPPKQLPRYQKGQHLRKADAQLWTRVSEAWRRLCTHLRVCGWWLAGGRGGNPQC